ncbi:MAG: hypothetical protein ABL977_04205 [Candidatus Eisenbacteria bacterium]
MGSDPRIDLAVAGSSSPTAGDGMNGSQANGVSERTAGLWHGAADSRHSVLAPERDMAQAAALSPSSHFSQPSQDDEQHAMPRVTDARIDGFATASRSEEESTGQSRSTGKVHRSHLTRDMSQE